MRYMYGPARCGMKIKNWSDLDENFMVYVAYDVDSDFEFGFSGFFLKNRLRIPKNIILIELRYCYEI